MSAPYACHAMTTEMEDYFRASAGTDRIAGRQSTRQPSRIKAVRMRVIHTERRAGHPANPVPIPVRLSAPTRDCFWIRLNRIFPVLPSSRAVLHSE